MYYVEGLPRLADHELALAVTVRGSAAYASCPQFIARISLLDGTLDWLIEQSPDTLVRPFSISVPDQLWVSETDKVVAGLRTTGDGGLLVSARSTETGAKLWEHPVQRPDAPDWVEATPAWPGAPTEEIDAFFALDNARLCVCLSHHSRRSMIATSTFQVMTLPPFAGQLDMLRLDPLTGKKLWSSTFPGVSPGILERRAFTGVWSSSPHLGLIDFETGTNSTLGEYPHALGWPALNGSEVAVPWHTEKEVGIHWLSTSGEPLNHTSWQLARTVSTTLHPTAEGFALQTNDQHLWWLGNERRQLWSVRARPYIYRVHRATETDVFIGTDGNGGRLLGFDAQSGRETINLKPSLGGVGDLACIPGHHSLVATFRVSKSYSSPPRLLILSMADRQHRLVADCSGILATWEHGVVCRAGRNGERLAIIDIRRE